MSTVHVRVNLGYVVMGPIMSRVLPGGRLELGNEFQEYSWDGRLLRRWTSWDLVIEMEPLPPTLWQRVLAVFL